MGGVASAVGDALGGIGDAIGNIEQSIVHTVEGAAKSVGHALESVGKTIANDPIGTLAKVAAVVTQQYWALPLISAADVVAHGGNLEQAAIAGGVSYLGGVVAAGVSDALATSAESTLESVSQTADGGTVYNYSDGSTMTTTAGGETSFTDPTGLSQNAANAVGSAAANAAKTLAQTGDISKAITSGAISGAGGYLGGEATGALKDQGLGSTAAGITGGIAGSTAAGVLAGKNTSDAMAAAISGTLMKTVMGQATSGLKSAWNDVNSTISAYNSQLDQTKAMFANELTPAQQEAEAAQATAKASYDNYTNLNNQFNDLVTRYNTAKDAGDAATANDLADQANALIPKLNAATDQYNTDGSAYQTALDKFNNVNTQFTTATNQLANLKNDYTAKNDTLAQESAALADATKQVAGMSTEAQTAFTNATGTGADIATALDTSTKVNGMNDIAQTTFNSQFAQNGDIKQSLDQAGAVNALDKNQLSAYSEGVKNNLNYDQALTVAGNAANYDAAGQSAYAQSVKAGNSEQDSNTLALLAQMSTPDTTAPITGTDVVGALTGSGNANAAEVPSASTPVQGTYHQDPSTGMWSVVGKDTSGKDVTLVPLAQGAGQPLVEGASAGTYNLGADNTATPVSSTPTLVSETTDPTTGNVTQKLSDGTTKVLDQNGDPVGTPGATTTEAQPGATDAVPAPTTADSTSGTGGPSIAAALGNTTGQPIGGTGTGGSASAGSASAGTSVTPHVVSAPLTWSNALGKWVTPAAAAAAVKTGAAAVGTGTPTTAAPATTASTDIKDLTPGLTKGSAFKFANEPTFTPQTIAAPQQPPSNPDYASEIMSAATGGSTNNAPTTMDLTPGLASASNKFKFASTPTFTPSTFNPVTVPGSATPQTILAAATGGSIPGYADGQSVQMPDAPSPFLRANTTRGHGLQGFSHFGGAQFPGYQPQRFAAGGSPDIPEGHNPQFFSEGGLNTLENKFVQGDGDGTSDSVAAMLAKGEFVIPADVVSDLGNGSNDAGANVLDEFLKTIREHKRAADSKNLPPDSKGALAYLLDAKRKVG